MINPEGPAMTEQACPMCLTDYTDNEQGCDACVPLKPHMIQHVEFVHSDGPDDMSDTYPLVGGYDSRCGWCYLGASHTLNAHAHKIRNA